MQVMDRSGRQYGDVHKYLDKIFGEDMHAKRIGSLADATYGVMRGGSLAVTIIGQSLAEACGLVTKSATKQVDRLLSNTAIVVWDIFHHWVPEVIGSRTDIIVAMDWTDFDSDGQTTLSLNLVTSHGRATPLIWRTVNKDDLKDRRNEYEDECLVRLSETLPKNTKATILADRGFGDTKLFDFLPKLGFDYVIRFRGNINVTAATGETRLASGWVGKQGRAVKLKDAELTTEQVKVGAVVCVHAKDMKDPWCLATNKRDATSRQIINYYSKRWTIEPNFRDTKDLRFGMGMSVLSISKPERRDCLLLLNAFAIYLLTMLGEAGESLGMDRLLRTSTTKRRTHSLFRQGCMLYSLIPTMPEIRLRPLMERFYELMQHSRVVAAIFATA